MTGPGRVGAGIGVGLVAGASVAVWAPGSARVVAAMAPAFLGVLAITSPADAAFLIRGRLGWATLAAAAVLELLGICWSNRIVRGSTP
jgi:Flp pilus assembly protein TadB